MAVVFLAVLAFGGHVTALPVTGHGGLAGATALPEGEADHAADGAHLASCDVTLSKVTPASPAAPTVGSRPIDFPAAPRPSSEIPREMRAGGDSPPLSLRHAALRI
jgi:hypothetical protein